MNLKNTILMILFCNLEALIISLILIAYQFPIWSLPIMITNLIITLILFVYNLWKS